MRVLVVDDNETFRRQTARYMGLHNVEVDTAARGEEALQALHRHRYDVVLLDLKMPDMHGLEVLRQAKADGIHAPIIVVTGYGDVASAVEAMKTGAVDFIEKPFEPERLLTLVRETAASYGELPSVEGRIQSLLAARDTSTAMLLVAREPAQLENRLSFTADERLELEPDDVSLAKLQEDIGTFMDSHASSFIVHADIDSLFQRHEADAVDRYLSYLHRRADTGDVTLLVLYDASMEPAFMDRIVNEGDIAVFVEDVIATLDHPIRRDVLYLLEQKNMLPYSYFLRRLGINHSAKLAFHLNQLQDDNLVEKTDAGYQLTERGHSFAALYRSLLMQRHHDTRGNVLYYPLPRKTSEPR